MTGTSLEVTGSSADQHFVLADDTLAASPADAAVRVHDDGSGLHEGVEDAYFKCLAVDRLACRNNEETDALCDFLSADDLCADAEIFDSSVVAGSKECFIDRRSAGLFCRNNAVYEIRFCNNRTDFGKVKGLLSDVYSVRLAAKDFF